MKLGIVGHEAAKFTAFTRRQAWQEMWKVIDELQPEMILSGECHLGGVDIWAHQLAEQLGIDFEAHAPEMLRWSDGPHGEKGFQTRNLEIAHRSDVVLVVVVRELPPTYKGMRFDGCYHCDKPGRQHEPHVKSGACWTAWQAKARLWRIV